MSRLSKCHPIGFLRHREMNNVIPSWDTIIDTRFDKAKNFFRKNLLAHYGCVNAIEFSDDGRWLLSGGDDRRVLIWDVQKTIHSCWEPMPMIAEHTSNIFALALDYRCSRIFSGGNDDQVIVHDAVTGTCLDYFVHEQPVYGLSTDPRNDNVFASACDDGRILIYDIREPASTEPFCLADTAAAFHSIMYNPKEPRLLVSANFKKGIALWDIRMPKRFLMKYGGPNSNQCCMSARFNRDGSRILALRKRLPPVLYSTDSTIPIFQFNNTGYYNSCTMKSCCFAGTNDEYVLSGSDNFDLYIWKIPPNIPPPRSNLRYVRSAHLVLQGHRSIVNQVRYNHAYSVIASSGVEKLIKLWSPFSLPSTHDGKSSYKLRGDTERRIYSHDDYINLIMQSGQFMSLTYDISRRNTREDPRMMAFFDALVQRDIKGMSDEDGPVLKVSYTNTAISFTSSSNDGYDSVLPSGGDDYEEDQNDPIVEENTNPLSRSFISTTSSGSSSEIAVIRSTLNQVDTSLDFQTSEQGENGFQNIQSEEQSNNQSVSNSQLNRSMYVHRGSHSSSNNDSDNESSGNLVVQVESAASVRLLLEENLYGAASDGESVSNVNSYNNNVINVSSVGNGKPSPLDDEEDEGEAPIKESNIITKMIAAKQEQLMLMAKAHMVREMNRRAAIRKAIREKKVPSTSSSSSSLAPPSSTESSDIDDILSSLKSKIQPLLWKKRQRKAHSSRQRPNLDEIRNLKKNKRSSDMRLPQKCKMRRYEATVTREGEGACKNSNANPNSVVINGSSAEDNRPCTSSSLMRNFSIPSPSLKSTTSISGSSRSFSSSDSDSSSPSPDIAGPSTKKPKLQPRKPFIVSLNLNKCDKTKHSSSSTSTSSSDVESTNEEELKPREKSSLAYRLSPVIRRLENDRRNRLARIRNTTETISCGSPSNNINDSNGGLPREKLKIIPEELERIKHVGRNEKTETNGEIDTIEGIVETEGDNINSRLSVRVESTTAHVNVTHDSGIEVSKNEPEQEIDGPIKLGVGNSDETSEFMENESSRPRCYTPIEETTTSVFKRNDLNRMNQRQYRRRKSDSD